MKKIFAGVAAGLVAAAAVTASSISLLVSANDSGSVSTSTSTSDPKLTIEHARYQRNGTGGVTTWVADKMFEPTMYSSEPDANVEQKWDSLGLKGSSNMLIADAVDHFVFVKNCGEKSAYIRTWLAFEQGSVSADDFLDTVGIHKNENESVLVWSDPFYNVPITHDDKTGNYTVMCATYKNPVAKGAVSEPSLLQVYMLNNGTNSTMEALDSDGDGKYKILIHSIAIEQGEIFQIPSADNHPWIPKPSKN